MRLERARDHLPSLAASLDPKVVYTDLDGTLLGPGGSLLAGTEGKPSLRAAQALVELERAGIAVVPVSGRTYEQVFETGRVLGADGFLAELGGVARHDGRVIREYGAFRGAGTPHEAMAATGAIGFLLEAFEGTLEMHAPWAFRPRECTMLLRGRVQVREADRRLADAGYGWLRLVDNGVIGRAPETRAYHLAPAGVTKANGVAADMRRRGLQAREAVAIGDAPSDAEIAAHVGAAFIVANGVEAVEAAEPGAGAVYATQQANGDGFAEVVLGLLS